MSLLVEKEVQERQNFLSEMSKLQSSKKLTEEIQGEIAEKLREMKVIQQEKEQQIRVLENISSRKNI